MLDSSRDILRSAIRRGILEDDLLALIDAIVAVEVDKARPRIVERQDHAGSDEPTAKRAAPMGTIKWGFLVAVIALSATTCACVKPCPPRVVIEHAGKLLRPMAQQHRHHGIPGRIEK